MSPSQENPNSITIDSSKERIDLQFVHTSISNTHWAKGRSMATTITCIDNSFNVGIYLNDKQIGYARVVSDYAVFAYVMDVFIAESYRGKGYSKQLMNYLLTCEALNKVSIWRLATTDAHTLYEKFGFKPLAHPEYMMELKRG